MLRSILGAALGVVLLIGSASCIHSAYGAERVWRLGWLDLNPPPGSPEGSFSLQAFRGGMHDLGYVETRDFVIEARFGDTDSNRLPSLAKELVDAGVDVIVTVGTPTTVAAKRATSTIPIVMTGTENPINRGLIASFAHPGGNVTGLTHQPSGEFWQKGLQLLKDVVPGITRVAVLTAGPLEERARVSHEGGLTLLPYELGRVRNLADLDAIFSKMREEHADAVFIFPDFVVEKFKEDIGNFIISNRLPAMTQASDIIERGALLYYYTDFGALRRRAAAFVDKIIKGAKPGELPVEQPAKFKFIVNLKTARALGVTVPSSITAFADQIIE